MTPVAWDYLFIEHAAKGELQGDLAQFPALEVALARHGVLVPASTPGPALRAICVGIVDEIVRG